VKSGSSIDIHIPIYYQFSTFCDCEHCGLVGLLWWPVGLLRWPVAPFSYLLPLLAQTSSYVTACPCFDNPEFDVFDAVFLSAMHYSTFGPLHTGRFPFVH